jgi:hypothetical protein
METHSAGRRRRLAASLAVMGLVAAGLYGITLWRFGVLMGGG